MPRLHPDIERALRGQKHPRLTFVRAGGLGDTLLVLPALQILLSELPELRVTFMGSAWAQELMPLMPAASGRLPRVQLLRFDSPLLTPLFGTSPTEDVTGCFAGADAVVLYVSRPGEGLAAAARRFCSGPVIEWPIEPAGGEHASAHFARAVAEPAAPPPLPDLAVPQELAEWSERWMASQFGGGTPVAAIHPGSGGKRKCWPAERFADLIRLVHRPVLLIEGPADAETCRHVRELAAGGTCLVPAQGMSVAQVGALLAACSLYAGNDSGLSHLAAALGVPTVAIFGPTDPAVWAPRGQKVAVVTPARSASERRQLGDCRWPPVAAALEAVRQVVSFP